MRFPAIDRNLVVRVRVGSLLPLNSREGFLPTTPGVGFMVGLLIIVGIFFPPSVGVPVDPSHPLQWGPNLLPRSGWFDWDSGPKVGAWRWGPGAGSVWIDHGDNHGHKPIPHPWRTTGIEPVTKEGIQVSEAQGLSHPPPHSPPDAKRPATWRA